MINRTIRALTLALVVSQLVACLGEVTGQNTQEIGAGCGTSDDCRPGLECEVEHGSATCQEHGGASDAGTSTRDADDSSDAGSSSDAGAGSRPLGASCVMDAECAVGLECETEHGVSTCQPHGRGGRNSSADQVGNYLFPVRYRRGPTSRSHTDRCSGPGPADRTSVRVGASVSAATPRRARRWHGRRLLQRAPHGRARGLSAAPTATSPRSRRPTTRNARCGVRGLGGLLIPRGVR